MPPMNKMEENVIVAEHSEKEFLYVGFYQDIHKNYVLKIGTTNDLERRRKEHTRNYRRSSNLTMPKDEEFKYLWHTKLSWLSTLRYENKNRQKWKEMGIGEFVRNDRFVLHEVPPQVEITIRKTYTIPLAV